MSKQANTKDFLIDTRISERNIRAGRLNKADFESHLSSLPDLKEQCEELSFDMFSSDRSRLAVTGEYSSQEDHDEEGL